jgi:hypothetical protein
MSATLLGLLSALLSTACLAALAASDPKRLRRRPSLGKLRTVGAIAAVLPGAVLLLMGLGVAFLIWLGSAAVLGWIVAAAISAFLSENRSQPESSSASNEKIDRP